MYDKPTAEEIAKMKKKLGLDEPEPLNNSLFQGDFGHSYTLSDLMPALILVPIVVFLIVYMKKRKKRSN